MLHQRALQLEWADPVVGALEHVVRAADVGDVAVLVSPGDVAGVIPAAAERLGGTGLVVEVAGHEAEGPWVERQRDLAFVRLLPRIVEQSDAIPRERPSHRAGLEWLARRVPDLRRSFGLPVSVPHRDAPGVPDPLDYLGVERL